MNLAEYLLWSLYGGLCAALMAYGLNSYVLIRLFLRRRGASRYADHQREQAFAAQVAEGTVELPHIVTQVPIYNEANVAERVIRACAAMVYPADRHEVQVLDDSNDETCDLIDAVAAELREQGKRVTVVRRTDRSGFKAGALNEGLRRSDAPFVAVFDSDFVPPADFLQRSLPHLLSQPDVGLVQSRWGHLNAGESWLTRALALGIDGHFAVEQPARSWNRLFLNFNGTAGLWRREAIDHAGGWQADTLTEDMDLSYRAQLSGWRIHYLPDLVTPAELPNTFLAFKSQQFRWAKGSVQTALKLLPQVMRAPGSRVRKVQAIFHLTHYLIHLCMFAMALLALPLMFAQPTAVGGAVWAVMLGPIVLATLGPSVLLGVSQWAVDRRGIWKALRSLPALIVIGFGISLSNSRGVLEALFRRPSAFIRTPKQGTTRVKAYRVQRNPVPWLEVGLGLYCAAVLVASLVLGRFAIGPFLIVYVAGYLVVGVSSLREARWA